MKNYYAILEEDNTFLGKFELNPKNINKFYRKVKDVNNIENYDNELYQKFGPTFEWDSNFLYRIFTIEPVPGIKDILLERLKDKFEKKARISTVETYTGLNTRENNYIIKESIEAINTAINENRLLEKNEFPMLDIIVDNFHNPYLKTNKIHSVLEAAQIIAQMEKEDKFAFINLYNKYIKYRKQINKATNLSTIEKLVEQVQF